MWFHWDAFNEHLDHKVFLEQLEKYQIEYKSPKWVLEDTVFLFFS